MIVSPMYDVSVLIPVCNEEENLQELYARLTDVLKQQQVNFELVFVDDGSTDTSFSLLETLAAQDHRVMIVELSRNFGHQAAIRAGLDYVSGKAVVIMDADLQDPPELLSDLIAKWHSGYEVVYTIRKKRENIVKSGVYKFFYRVLRTISSVDIPVDSGDFCLLDYTVVEKIRSMPEKVSFFRGIRSWVGFKQIGVPYNRAPRLTGKSSYALADLFTLAFDGFISFSHVPLRIASFLGMLISCISLGIGGFFLIKKLTVGLEPPGFATLVVSIFFLAGIQLITIGIIGEYVGRILDEVKSRPLFVVRRVVRSE